MVEPVRDPKKLQEQLDEFQNLQRQMQIISMQRQQVQMQLEELKVAGEELKKADGTVYKAAGNLLVPTTKGVAAKEVEERIESFEVRATTLGKQEEKMRARIDSLRAELEKMVGPASRGGAPAG